MLTTYELPIGIVELVTDDESGVTKHCTFRGGEYDGAICTGMKIKTRLSTWTWQEIMEAPTETVLTHAQVSDDPRLPGAKCKVFIATVDLTLPNGELKQLVCHWSQNLGAANV